MKLPGAIFVFALILAHIVAWGAVACRVLGARYRDPLAHAGVIIGLGTIFLGLEIIALGHAHLLQQSAMFASAAACAVALAWLWRGSLRTGDSGHQTLPRAIGDEVRAWPMIAGSCALFVLLIFISGTRPVLYADEKEYHWPSPMLWAHAHGWEPSPYRHSNGPMLMHALYTVSAIWTSSTAAHWTHTMMLVCLLLSAAALARQAGAPGAWAVAACLSIPCIVTQSSISYTDTAAASLLLAGYAALLCESPERETVLKVKKNSYTQGIVAGVLFAGAVSIKPFTVLGIVGAGIAALGAVNSRPSKVQKRFAHLALIAGPALLAIMLWSLRTYSLIGKWWEVQGIWVHSALEPAWIHGWAVGRVPQVADLVKLPFIFLEAPLFGQREPLGGRTGPLLLAGLPVLILYLWRKRSGLPKPILTLCLGAFFYFALLSPFAVKTRFHDFTWAVVGVLIVVAWSSLTASLKRRAWAEGFFATMVWAGMVDSSRILIRGLWTHFG